MPGRLPEEVGALAARRARAPAATRAGSPASTQARQRRWSRFSDGERAVRRHVTVARTSDEPAARRAGPRRRARRRGHWPSKALEDLPARAVVQHALLHHLVERLAGLALAVDDDELARDPARLGEEARALGLLEVAVEVARVKTGRSCRPGTAARARRPRRTSRRAPVARASSSIARALVEPDDVARQVLREEAGAAGDVERARRRQRAERRRRARRAPPPSPAGRARANGRARATSRRTRAPARS